MYTVRAGDVASGSVARALVDYTRIRNPASVLDTFIERHSAEAIVLHSPPTTWGRAATARLPSYQVGGNYEKDQPVCLAACGLGLEIARAVTYLKKHGHRRILIPLDANGAQLRRTVLLGLRNGMGELPTQGTWEDYCPVFSENVPTVWRDYWRQALQQLHPTAVILLSDFHVLSLYGYCANHGIRIPSDLSVISMAYEPRFEWCQPRPTMMRYPTQQALAHFRNWLAGEMRPMGVTLLPLQMVEGESVAKASR